MAAVAGSAIKRLVEKFRKELANDIAALADKAGRSGRDLAIMARYRDACKACAKELERRCLAEGTEVPLAPNEI